MKFVYLNKKRLLFWSIILGLTLNFVIFVFSSRNHWTDFNSGSRNTRVLMGSSNLSSVKYDYGFPLRFYDNSVGFGGHVFWEAGIKPIWLNAFADMVFWTAVILLCLSLVRYSKFKTSETL